MVCGVRIKMKGSTEAQELSKLASRLLDARASELANKTFGEYYGQEFSASQSETISAQVVAGMAFQV